MGLVQAPRYHLFLMVPLGIFVIDKLITISRSKIKIAVVKAEPLPSSKNEQVLSYFVSFTPKYKFLFNRSVSFFVLSCKCNNMTDEICGITAYRTATINLCLMFRIRYEKRKNAN